MAKEPKHNSTPESADTYDLFDLMFSGESEEEEQEAETPVKTDKVVAVEQVAEVAYQPQLDFTLDLTAEDPKLDSASHPNFSAQSQASEAELKQEDSVVDTVKDSLAKEQESEAETKLITPESSPLKLKVKGKRGRKPKAKAVSESQSDQAETEAKPSASAKASNLAATPEAVDTVTDSNPKVGLETVNETTVATDIVNPAEPELAPLSEITEDGFQFEEYSETEVKDNTKQATASEAKAERQEFEFDPNDPFAAVNKLTAHLSSQDLEKLNHSAYADFAQGAVNLNSLDSKADSIIKAMEQIKDLDFIYSQKSIDKATPMMKQYLLLKAQHRDKILFFRMGDFYEFFFDDAILTARELSLAVSTRQTHLDLVVPMAGVPYHAYESYATKLVNKGYSIAIAEQVSDPKEKGLTERDIVRIMTPGTLSETNYLPQRESKPLAAVYTDFINYAVALLDVSTGFFEVSILDNYNEFINRITQYAPAELIYCQEQLINEHLENLCHLSPIDEEYFRTRVANDNLKAVFGKEQQKALQEHKVVVPPCGALVKYVTETQKVTPSHLQSIRFAHEDDLVALDSQTLQNLELFNTNSGNKQSSFIEVLDKCSTSMGARLFRRWVRQPTRNLRELNQRLDQVEIFLKHDRQRNQLTNLLKSMGDMERVVARISLGNASPKDLGELRNNLLVIPRLNQQLAEISADLKQLPELEPIRNLLLAALEDQQPMFLRDGGVIRSSFSEELASYRDLKDNILTVLEEIEEKEQERTGIDNLSIKLSNTNEIFIHIPAGSLAKITIPENYIHKQSLKSASRFITTELRDIEISYNRSEQQIAEIEKQIFTEILAALKTELQFIQNLANQVARLDVYLCFAQLAFAHGYVRPQYSQDNRLEIIQGRHPVIEVLSKTPFIPNDSCCDSKANLAIITGPNMGGKSTYMRQNALISLLALIGSFVPAQSACIPLFDKICTRIGASDDISTGRSTFMVEMAEMANILKQATKDSLLLIDEIGRGTSTFDGLSLAWACAQFLAQKVKAITFFSTHYFELTSLADLQENVVNLHVAAIEHNDEISFLHEIKPGRASKSYGLAVAKLAGIPDEVIAIAHQQLDNLAQTENHNSDKAKLTLVEVKEIPATNALKPEQQQVLELLSKVNPNELTPIRGLEFLLQLQEILKSKG